MRAHVAGPPAAAANPLHLVGATRLDTRLEQLAFRTPGGGRAHQRAGAASHRIRLAPAPPLPGAVPAPWRRRRLHLVDGQGRRRADHGALSADRRDARTPAPAAATRTGTTAARAVRPSGRPTTSISSSRGSTTTCGRGRPRRTGDRRTVDGRLRRDELRRPAPRPVRRRRQLLRCGRHQQRARHRRHGQLGVRPARHRADPLAGAQSVGSGREPARGQPYDPDRKRRARRTARNGAFGLGHRRVRRSPDEHQLPQSPGALGIPSIWDDYGPGGHAWPYWQRDLRQTLPTFMSVFAHPRPPPSSFTFTAVEPRLLRLRLVGRACAGRALEFSTLRVVGRSGFSLTGSGTRRPSTTARLYRAGRRRCASSSATRRGRGQRRLTVDRSRAG